MSEKYHHRARRANALMRGDTETAELAGRDLRAAMLSEHIQKAVAEKPPFTEDQIRELSALLRPVGGA